MKNSSLSLLAAAILAVAAGLNFGPARAVEADSTASEQASALAELQGAWTVKKIVSAGKIVPHENSPFEVHFEKPNRMHRKGIRVGNVTGRDRVDEIKLDSSKKPAAMDITQTVRGNGADPIGHLQA